MRSPTRWQPWVDLIALQDAMDRLFDEGRIFSPDRGLPPSLVGGLALDVYETDDEVVVRTGVPGVNPDDIDITIEQGMLTIRGETRGHEEVKHARYICRECRYGAFSRSVVLPAGIDADNADATFESGVLTLRVPKLGKAKPKTIVIEPK